MSGRFFAAVAAYLDTERPPGAGTDRLAAVLMGVVGYAASFLLYNYAIARVQAASANIVVHLIPVFGLASAVC